ncbi:cytochrome P450 family protein [Allokutzneria oryzae]|uniref:P450-derived glycosyltransferase activator n=1 Tax=Allokutzneria oryzae TaxID=1378989 RepID=A0ABV5ZTF5_9PSEU
MSTLTDSELGGMMQLVRGTQWYVGMFGDAYALVLRGQADDPSPFYAAARERGMHQNLLGTWVVAGHELGRQILADPRFGVRKADGTPAAQQVLPLENSYLGLDAADRERLLRQAAAEFGPDAVGRHRAVAEGVCEQLLGAIDGPFDLVGDFAFPVAVRTLAQLLGIEDDERFAGYCAAVGIAQDALLSPQRLAPARELVDALDGLGEQLRESGKHGDSLAAAVLLVVHGVPAVTSLVTNAVLALGDQRPDPALAPKVVAETLRFDPPEHVRTVVAHTDVEIGGNTVAADSQVAVLLAAANRDPEVYADPDHFDIHRQGPDPLAPQGELAAPLARFTAEAALSTLLTTFPTFSVEAPVLRRRRSPVTRGVLRATVRP